MMGSTVSPPPPFPIRPLDITGLVLAGGQGTRMDGADKGLQPFQGHPLAWHALHRLQPQVGALLVSANRNPQEYAALALPFAAPVLPDSLNDYAGPLAGFLAGLAHCRSPWLLTVPCDTPRFPADLALRLALAAEGEQAEISMACALEPDDKAAGQRTLRSQPVFCLLRADLYASLLHFTEGGGRKIGAWTAQHRCVRVAFDRPGDDPLAFANANSLAELQALERAPKHAPHDSPP
jgi:molybdopterin-guanine dinucleotide biosynthesis protein A